MKKKKGLVLIILLVVIIIVIGAYFLFNKPNNPSQTKEQLCINSGGTVTASSCCGSVSDFPNTCAIGACGCSPANSHNIQSCNCGAGKCFDGNACVSFPSISG
ncbi:MAG TPA: hypothetical protein VMC80_00845 [Patescibacteria group bacterium]|nr:hypothetical protein [Patescibacteria group bacterium]